MVEVQILITLVLFCGLGYGGTNISAFITVFINGMATELPKGPIDMKTVFGEDVILVHSSGVPILTNEFGFLMHNLQHGESYFLVGRIFKSIASFPNHFSLLINFLFFSFTSDKLIFRFSYISEKPFSCFSFIYYANY